MTIEAILLGTAQDGGLPQAGCSCPNCRDAWVYPDQRQQVSCLGLVDRSASQGWLIDATPDLPTQLRALRTLAPGCALAGILLTHAHMGHYTGLMHLGREAWNTANLPVLASPRMARFLRQHAPWSQLVALGNIELQVLTPGTQTSLSTELHVTPLLVPHRDEWSDTLAFVVEGPRRRLIYCPDIDGWEEWQVDVRGLVASTDIALLDGTFFSAVELPGRDLGQIRHPLATDTAEKLTGVACDVRLVHLNHSNPLHRPGAEQDWLAARGIGVGSLGDRWSL